MKRGVVILLVAGAALVAGLAVAAGDRRVPLGVRGEWEWARIEARPGGIELAVAVGGVGAYAGFVFVGGWSLARRSARGREAAWVAGLVAAAVAVQVMVQEGAPYGYGLTKWALALHNAGSSGYYTVAKREIRDPWRFLADAPGWTRAQTVPRLGAHPPGLFLAARGLLGAMESRPEAARRILAMVPASVDAGFREIDRHEPLPRADRAALALTGALTLLACAATVIPLYLLARAAMPPTGAWAAAALWPLVPAAVLFQPAADTAFPLLSASALALAARGRFASGAAAGVVLASGMAFTLAFLPVGLAVALLLGSAPRGRVGLILATGAGFLVPTLAAWAVTRANPFAVWWWNQVQHARFYRQFPRSYGAWVLVNPIELAVALGLPAAAWAVVGLAGRPAPRAAWASLVVMAVLTLSGKNLSEVARLWLPLMPPLLVASAAGLARLGAGPKALAATAALMGVQTLALQAMIQVVYPV